MNSCSKARSHLLALLNKIDSRFRRRVARFTESTGVPVVRVAMGKRKAEVMHPYLEAAAAAGGPWSSRCGRGRRSSSGCSPATHCRAQRAFVSELEVGKAMSWTGPK